MKSRKNITLYSLLVVGVAILVGYLSNQLSVRLDFTEDHRFTLSDATRDLLQELEEPITITAYFSDNLPPQLLQIKREFQDLLTEYSRSAKGNLEYEFVDPLKDENIQAVASRDGVNPIQLQVEEKDQVKAQVAYMGAVIQLGEETEAIPMISAIQGLEYKISSSIKKLAVTEKPLVGFVQGHGEASFGEIWEAKQALDVLNKTELVNLSDSSLDVNKYNTLVFLGPKDSLSGYELARVDAYIQRGGRILAALDRSDADLTTEQFTHPVNTGLEQLLASRGIAVNDHLVTDLNCQRGLIQPRPGYIMQVTIPYYIIAKNFEDHPISSGLEQVMFSFASSVDFRGDSTVKFMPLIESSEHSGSQSTTVQIDITSQYTPAEFPLSHLTLAAALEGSFQGSAPTRMVIVGDGDFAKPGQRGQQVNPDNVNLLVNAIDWLSDDTGLIQLRTQGATARPLDDIEEGKRTFLKYLNFLLPVVLALIYGIIRFQRNRMIRLKRKEAGYVY